MKDENDASTIDFVGGDRKPSAGYYLPVMPPKVTGRRYKGSKTPDSIRSIWRTPDWLFKYLDKRFGQFEIDLAACEKSTKCDAYFCKEENSLIQDWGAFKSSFLNPPYNDITPWVKKAIETMATAKKGNVIVMVLPNDNSTVWYRLAVKSAKVVINLISDGDGSGRVAFIDAATGLPVTGNSKGTNIFVFVAGNQNKNIATEYVDIEDISEFMDNCDE